MTASPATDPTTGVPEPLVAFCHRRWSLPIVAELYRTSGAKFVTLLKRLGASRDGLTQTLEALVERDWIERNPGYGHPMRPEYVLTAKGQRLGPPCDLLREELDQLGAREVALKKWSLPVLWGLGKDLHRFGELKEALGDITPRALAQALKDLQEAELVEREVAATYPPQVRYRLAPKGTDLRVPLFELTEQLGSSS